MSVLRQDVFEVLEGTLPVLERKLAGWSLQPRVTGTGAVGLYIDGPPLPLAGVSLTGQPQPRHLCATVQSADRGLPQHLEQVRYQYILGISVTEHEAEYPTLEQLPTLGEPSWVGALRLLDERIIAGKKDALLISRGGYVPGRRVLGTRRVALRKHFFEGKPWLGLGTIDWCAGVRSLPVSAERLGELVEITATTLFEWDAALR